MDRYSEENNRGEIRKNKVINFLEKDIFIINNYEQTPFKNRNHAVECMIPYHVFQTMADDLKFKESDVSIDLSQAVQSLNNKISSMIDSIYETGDGFLPQLLLYYEQKYIKGMLQKKIIKEGRAGIIRIPAFKHPTMFVGSGRIRMRKMKDN